MWIIKMNELLDIEIVLNKNKYSKIYNIGTILILITLIFIYITSIYRYQTYLIVKGKVTNNYLELLLDIEDIKYISTQNKLIIDNQNYDYKIISISDNLYIDELYNNYKYVYLEVKKLNNINNYVYEVKIKKENKKIIEYLKDYL